MNLFIRKYSDYRTGNKITVSDIDDLIHEYIKREGNVHSIDIILIGEKNDIETTSQEEIANKALEKLMDDESLLAIINEDGSFKFDTTDKYSLYIITGEAYDEYEIFHIKTIEDQEMAEKLLMQIFSDINNCQPFVMTDLTPGYREVGYYPGPLPLMDGVSLVDSALIRKISMNQYCVAIIITGNILYDYIQI